MSGDELLSLFNRRQSTRAYAKKPVEKEKLMRCIEAARLAPSASNAQPWKFIVVDDPALKNAVADGIAGKIVPINHFTRQAPILVCVVRERANLLSSLGQEIKSIDYPLIDIGIAAIQFCLQATTEGLGTCMLGWFDEKKVKRLLNVPRNKKIELIISVGYPASPEIRIKKRKYIEQILSFNAYS